LVKGLALKAMKEKTLLYELAVDNSGITDHLTKEELDEAFDPKFYLHNIDTAKKRLGLIT
jgi:adenylosuccinate lyase